MTIAEATEFTAPLMENNSMAPMKAPSQQEHDDEIDDSYSLTHLAHRWGVSRRTIRRMLQNGELPFVQIDGQLRVPIAVIRNVECGEKSSS